MFKSQHDSCEIKNLVQRIELKKMKKDITLCAGDAEKCVCASGHRVKSRQCVHTEAEAHFRNPLCNLYPKELTEKEDTVQARKTNLSHSSLTGLQRIQLNL